MRRAITYASLAMTLAFMDASVAFAQDGSRIVMRRPLDAAASPSPSPGTPAPTPGCGGPENPCPVTCDFSEPQWNAASSDPNVCTGSVGPANATCTAIDDGGSRVAVPDSLCLQSVSSYLDRCPSFSGIPGSGPVAGVRPETAPGTRDCTSSGVAVVISVGQPRVATGLLGGDGIWRISGFNAGEVPVCSYPTAAPAVVECRVNGVPSSPSNCSVASYSNLYGQNLVPVSPGGVTPADIRQAQWVRPGYYVGGCSAQWNAVDGAVPAGCGDVTVSRTVTCEASNAQSSDIPEEYLSCNPATRPADSYVTQDYRSCTIAMESDLPGPWSSSCGTATRSTNVYCRRSDGQGLELSSAECSPVVSSYCASLPAGRSCGSQGQFALEVIETADLGACPDPLLTTYDWQHGSWGAWSTDCGPADRTRTVQCTNGYGTPVNDSFCISATRPASQEGPVEQTSGCAVGNSCPAGQPPVPSDSFDRPSGGQMDLQCSGSVVDGVGILQEGAANAAAWRDSCIAAGGTCAHYTYTVQYRDQPQEREESYYECRTGYALRSSNGEGGNANLQTYYGAFNTCGITNSGSCSAPSWQVTGDTCEGGTMIADGEYHYRSPTHPGGNFSNGTREQSTGMTSELACIQAGGNCWQEQKLPHTEYGEWDEQNDYFECHAGATSISADGTHDGLPNVTDPEFFNAGFLSCSGSPAPPPSVTTLYSGRGYGVQGSGNCPLPSDPADRVYSEPVTTPPAGNVAGNYVRENRDCYEAGGTRMEFTMTQCTFINDNFRQDYDEGGTYRCLKDN